MCFKMRAPCPSFVSVSVIVTVALTLPGLKGEAYTTEGWTGVTVDKDRRVVGAQTLVDLTASNARRCLRMCWLFRACSALTFTLSRKRCHLFLLSGSDAGAYQLTTEIGSESMDTRAAKVDTRLIRPRGCDKRPCTLHQMCAPVRNLAFYVCLQLASQFCHGDPPNVPNSIPEKDGVISVTYACAPGYFRTGSNNVSNCNRRKGTWTSVDTTCSLVDCGSPPTVSGATAQDISTTADSVVYYTCLTGGVPSSPVMSSTCEGSSQQWSPVPGPCVSVSCGQPPSVVNTDFTLELRSLVKAFPGLDQSQLNVAYGGVAEYTCSREGYTAPPGSRYISQCQEDGTWSSSTNFVCSPVDCGTPPTLLNTRPPVYTTTTFGNTATVTCLAGFSPSESVTFTCRATGQWEASSQLTCVPEPVDCGTPPALDYAGVEAVSPPGAITTKAGSVVSYNCQAVAIPTGHPMTITCDVTSRAWTSLPGVCAPVDCGQPRDVDRMSYVLRERPGVQTNPALTDAQIRTALGGQAEYTCLDGYTASAGASYISTCEQNSIWSATDNFQCTPIDCGQPASLQNAHQDTHATTTFGASVTVRCLSGYRPSEGVTFNCNKDGDWEPTGSDRTCEPVDCGEPPSVTGASKLYYETILNSKVRYTCTQPAVIQGEDEEEETCETDGQWSSASLTCSPVPCDAAREEDHSWFKYALEDGVYKAVYTCDAGYEHAQDSSISCQTATVGGAIGTWEVKTIQCRGVSCGNPPVVANAAVSLTGSNFPYNAEYTCNQGFTQTSADSTKTCQQDATWSNVAIVCTETKCSLPPAQNIQFDPPQASDATFSIGVTLNIRCKTGLTMVPRTSNMAVVSVASVTCEDKGEWSRSPGVYCVSTTCGVPQALPSTTWSMNGREVVYECVAGSNLAPGASGVMETNQTVECNPSTGWDIPSVLQPGCSPIDCGQIQFPADSPFLITPGQATTLGSTVEVSCRAPLYLNSANNVMTCQADWTWTVLVASDVCAACDQSGQVTGIPNGLLRIGDGSGAVADTASFSCGEGYHAIGASEVIRCASVNKVATWQGLESAKCLQVVWNNPSTISGVSTKTYAVEIWQEVCCPHGLEACARLTFDGDDSGDEDKNQLVLMLADVDESGTDYFKVARVKFSAGSNRLRMETQMSTGSATMVIRDQSTNLMASGQSGRLCITYNVAQGKYEFTKDGVFQLAATVRASQFNYFAIQYAVTVSEITLNFNYNSNP